MKNQEWTYYDKTKWPEVGPWTNEIDKCQFVDEVTGLPCLTVRNQLGAWCGYVGVPEGHPLYAVNYNDYDGDIAVHGGLTFSGPCHPAVEGYDGPTICHVPDPGESDQVWWFGFDTAHFNDFVPNMSMSMPSRMQGTYRDLAYVQQECRSLALQLSIIAAEEKK